MYIQIMSPSLLLLLSSIFLMFFVRIEWIILTMLMILRNMGSSIAPVKTIAIKDLYSLPITDQINYQMQLHSTVSSLFFITTIQHVQTVTVNEYFHVNETRYVTVSDSSTSYFTRTVVEPSITTVFVTDFINVPITVTSLQVNVTTITAYSDSTSYTIAPFVTHTQTLLVTVYI